MNDNDPGGCSLGCASVVVLSVLWILLHSIGGQNPEPDVMLFPALIGIPSFLFGNVLAIAAMNSKSEKTRASGRIALRIMWGLVAVYIVGALVVGFVLLIRSNI